MEKVLGIVALTVFTAVMLIIELLGNGGVQSWLAFVGIMTGYVIIYLCERENSNGV